MVALGSLLLVIALSLLVVRIGTIALTMTGLSEEVARFQSLSAFSGAGYTTAEAENITTEAARRRIVAFLIRAGSVGAVSAIATAIAAFVGSEGSGLRLFILLGLGSAGIILVARSSRLNRWATPLIRRGLQRFTTLDLRDYAGLLHLQEDWQVSVMEVGEGGWLADSPLADLELDAEGVTVLGIERAGGTFRGAPSSGTVPGAGDRLIVYGRAQRLKELQGRGKGDEAAHARAKAEHSAEKEQERRDDDAA